MLPRALVSCLLAVACAAPARRAAPGRPSNPGPPPRLSARPSPLRTWKPPPATLLPRERVALYEVTCESDSTKPSVAPRCQPSAGDREGDFLFERLAACFDAHRGPPPAAVLQRLESRWRELVEAPRFAPVFDSGDPHAFTVVHFSRTSLVDELRGGGCEGPRPPNMGCDPVVMPTGRKVAQTWPGKAHAFPQGWEDPWLTGLPAETYWIEIGPPSPALPEPRAALAALEQVDPSGSADVEAAVLADTAIASFRLGELRAGAEATRKLRARLDAGGVDVRMLALVPTAAALERIAEGKALTVDPCTGLSSDR